MIPLQDVCMIGLTSQALGLLPTPLDDVPPPLEEPFEDEPPMWEPPPAAVVDAPPLEVPPVAVLPPALSLPPEESPLEHARPVAATMESRLRR